MKNNAISFKIKNQYGRYLYDVIEPLADTKYKWFVENDDVHLIEDNEFMGRFLFSEKDTIINIESLYSIAKNNTYYLVSLTLRAFSNDGIYKNFKTYKEFLDSDCKIAIGIYDCIFVMFWCKDEELLSKVYRHALTKNFQEVKYISGEDLIKEKYCIE